MRAFAHFGFQHVWYFLRIQCRGSWRLVWGFTEEVSQLIYMRSCCCAAWPFNWKTSGVNFDISKCHQAERNRRLLRDTPQHLFPSRITRSWAYAKTLFNWIIFRSMCGRNSATSPPSSLHSVLVIARGELSQVHRLWSWRKHDVMTSAVIAPPVQKTWKLNRDGKMTENSLWAHSGSQEFLRLTSNIDWWRVHLITGMLGKGLLG